MEKKIELKVMRCPTCGGELKVEKENTVVECVYCGNTVTPIVVSGETSGEFQGGNGFVKIDGIKTASSALAYLELFLEEYDWFYFTFGEGITIPELERISETLKTTSADNFETWQFCFRATLEPFARKCEQCSGLVKLMIDRYREDDPDAYSLFDAFKRVSVSLRNSVSSVVEKLNKYYLLAKKYGADEKTLNALRAQFSELKNNMLLPKYEKIDDIPEILAYNNEKDARTKLELSSRGIDADHVYDTAMQYQEKGENAKALDAFLSLGNYKDSARIVKDLNHFFLIDQVLEIGKHRFVFHKDKDGNLNLSSTKDKAETNKPALKGIKEFLAVYADKLFYIDSNQNLAVFDVKENKMAVISKERYSSKHGVLENNAGAYYLFTATVPYSLCKIDFRTLSVTTIAKNIKSVVEFSLPYLVCRTIVKKEGTNNQNNIYSVPTEVSVINVRTKKRTTLGNGSVQPAGYLDNSVVYTETSPDRNNLNLYIKSLDNDAPAVLLEKNIYKVNKIYSGTIYYTVGSEPNQTLISICPDGSNRHEISLHIKNLLMECGGWLYFVRSTLYNSVMFRSRPDGSEQKVICQDVDSFEGMNNGYLYYKDTNDTLNRVRMDGSSKQKLCTNVENILSISDDCIIYTSWDSTILTDSVGNRKSAVVKSIYATDFYGKGKRKLAYNILEAKQMDEDTIYFITKESSTSIGGVKKALNEIVGKEYKTNKLLNYITEVQVKKEGCYVATCVYGSYDCPQVWTLRRFRDNILARHVFGRLFIALYYAISPTLVRLFGDTGWFRSFWKRQLDFLVAELRSRGVDHTPLE